jgi:seryl-tRNA synthetase
MLPLSFIRENPDLIKKAAKDKGYFAPVDQILELDARRRAILTKLESLRAEQNAASKRVARDKNPEEIERLRHISKEVDELDDQVKSVEQELEVLLLEVPNPAHPSVPVGFGEERNVVIREWGKLTAFDFEPRPHYEIGKELGILEFETAAKIAGSRFAVLWGIGARLERVLIDFMLDLHTREHGYLEVLPPYLVNSAAMVGTANLPKFAGDVFKVADEDLYLIPTAEVPLTNLHREEILDGSILPLKYVAYSPCFRSEAGAAGKDTRGYIRLHQFNKVELVQLTKPEQSLDALEELTRHAEEVLQRLNLPYRVLLMCTGETGFAQWKKYDIEVWCPGIKRYLEVSSCSVFGDFQARRANIRFRRSAGQKPEYVHTLNGSGLALPRTIVAILENYQQKDGSVIVPPVLRESLGCDIIRTVV